MFQLNFIDRHFRRGTFAIVFLICFAAFAQAQIRHVEPLNWWVGMKNPNLQLLVHGDNIGETVPVIQYPGVTIQKVSRGDSKNYVFIDLLFSADAKPGNLKINFAKNNKTLFTYDYPLLQRKQDASYYQGFNSGDAIYLITPDRFVDGDITNDVIPSMAENKVNRQNEGGRHGGDIRGIIDHLDYIKDLGFTAIWPQPLLENNMQAYSYHGYSITNHYRVDPRFGTLDEYKELAMKARDKGIKLIFDGVVNHIGSGHWWMKDLPFKNWVNYPDTLVFTNHRRTIQQDQYASVYDKELMTRGWFDTHMPDLNSSNAFVATYLIQNSIWWIETLQLGGIRQDTYCYSDKSFLKNWSCSVMNEYPNFNIVGEEWSVNPLVVAYWQQGKTNSGGYESCLKSVMDFPLQSALVKALTDKGNQNFGAGMNHLYEALANDFNYADPFNIMIFGDNHDMDRLYTQLDKDLSLMKMAVTYLLTTRGIVQLYYGTEILAENSLHPNNHGYIRSDFPGGWADDKVNGFTGQGLNKDQLNFQEYLKKMLNWRRNNEVIAKGKILHFAPFDGVYVYFRYDENKTVMVVMNKKNQPVTISTSRFQEILKGRTQAQDVMTGEKISLENSMTIAGNTASILEVR